MIDVYACKMIYQNDRGIQTYFDEREKRKYMDISIIHITFIYLYHQDIYIMFIYFRQSIIHIILIFFFDQVSYIISILNHLICSCATILAIGCYRTLFNLYISKPRIIIRYFYLTLIFYIPSYRIYMYTHVRHRLPQQLVGQPISLSLSYQT